MKRLGKISLRMRITLLTGAVILLTSGLLTYSSTYNAGNYFHQLTGAITARPLQSVGDVSTSLSAITPSAAVPVGKIVPIEGMIQSVPAEMIMIKLKKQFDYSSYVRMAVVACLGMAGCWFLAGRALAPVRQLRDTAVKISAHNLSSRIPETTSKDEIGELTEAFNGMLNRLEESFEQQKRFSSNVAHELKTPLATLKMSLQVGDMEYGAGECGEIFAVAERSVDRLARLVDDLTKLTNQGTLEMNHAISLCSMLQGIACELEPVYAHKALQVEYDFSEAEVTVWGNGELVRRIFYNLVENAMKYNEMGGIIRIGVQREDGRENGKNCVWVEVSDSGPGMAEPELRHIFEPFYCVDPSRSRKLGGAGLGLAIVKEAAERHGWNVNVESVQGVGTSFVVEIPGETLNHAV